MRRLYFILLLIVGIFAISSVNASALNTPEITGFAPSSIEKNALTVTIKSNNTGTNYSYELINTTNGTENNLSGSITSFTIQNLYENTKYGVMIRACTTGGYNCSNWSNVIKATTTSEQAQPAPQQTPQTNKCTINTNLVSYTFNNTNKNSTITAKASNGSQVTFSSSNTAVATVTSGGVVTSKKAGSATITLSAANCDPVKVSIVVPGFKSREKALDPWRHMLIDTFFYINDRKYSTSQPSKYWFKNGDLKTGKSGNTQSCITLPNVSAKRMGFFKSSHIWFSDGNGGSKPNSNVRNLKKNSKFVSVYYPHKSLSSLHKSGGVLYGDILCRSGHTFVYMGSKSRGLKIYQSGGNRDLGNGTHIYYKHGKKSSKKVINKSNQKGKDWRAGKIPDSAFTGVKASGTSKKIHIVVRPQVYYIYTSCSNGTITTSNLYLAAQNYTINYAPNPGYKLSSVTVDGKSKSISTYAKSYTFNKLDESHSIHVVFTK